MRVLVRCDGGPGMGVGHAIRSIALIEEACARGHDVAVVGSWEGDLLGRMRERLPATVSVLPAPVEGDHDGLAALAEGADVLHVDSYTIGEGLAGAVRARSGQTLVSVLHDGDFGLRSADLLIDPTPGARPAAPQVPARWRVSGGRFTPVRAEVLRHRQTERHERGSQPLRVLVTLGGGDTVGAGPHLVSALLSCGVITDLTVLAAATTVEQLTDLAASRSEAAVTVLETTPDLPALMAECDLLVSAAGTTVWEGCATGTPMAVRAIVDNQVKGYDALVGARGAVGLGTPSDSWDEDEIARRLRPPLLQSAVRGLLSAAARRVVDGHGAWRIVSAWEVAHDRLSQAPRPLTPLQARPARSDDAALLHAWRNDPVTRSQSREQDEVPWETHVAWLTATLARPDRILVVVEDAQRPVGTVRFDRLDDGSAARHSEWEVSISLAPNARGAGLAHSVLDSAEKALQDSHGSDGSAECVVLATVHRDNGPSRRLFIAAGYLPESPADERGFERWIRHLPCAG